MSETRADEVGAADLRSGSFSALPFGPPGGEDITGRAWIARSDDGTTVTVELAGLTPGEEYVAHLHVRTCAEGGGEHFRFDPGGHKMPPNEIHLAFTADDSGTGFMTAVNKRTAGEDARSVIVHPQAAPEEMLTCATF